MSTSQVQTVSTGTDKAKLAVSVLLVVGALVWAKSGRQRKSDSQAIDCFCRCAKDIWSSEKKRLRPCGFGERWSRFEGHRQERPFGRWSRTVTLPDRVDSTEVSASFAEGVLTINLPKAEEAKPRQIVVSARRENHKGSAPSTEEARS